MYADSNPKGKSANTIFMNDTLLLNYKGLRCHDIAHDPPMQADHACSASNARTPLTSSAIASEYPESRSSPDVLSKLT